MGKKRHGQQPEELSDEIKQFAEVLQEERDRGCVLVAAAFLDAALYSLLKAYCLEEEDIVADLSKLRFRQKTNLAFGLGLLGRREKENLDRIRTIRNEFAHSYIDTTFDSQNIRDRINSLHIISLPPGTYKWKNPREKLIVCTLFLANVILMKALALEHRKQSDDALLFSD